MINKLKYICKCCGKEFIPKYKLKSNSNPQYCSKQCQLDTYRPNKQKYYNKTQLENAIKKEIISQKKYLTVQDICKSLNISTKTLSKFRISILQLNRACNMRKPKSMFEFKVKEYFFNKFEDCVEEQTFETCVSPKGYLLKFDIFIPSKNILIEADGTQHYNKNNPNFSEYCVECDNIKNIWCAKNKYLLIRIPYTKNVTDTYIEKFINNI